MKNPLKLTVANPTLYPEVADILRRLPADATYHVKHKFRHPAAIYQLSLGQLGGDLNRVMDDLEEAKRHQAWTSETQPKVWTESEINLRNAQLEKLAQSQRILTYSLREHIDDCHMILRCLIDPAKAKTGKAFGEKYLEAAKFTERSLFWNEVNSHLDGYITPLVNSLKHGQGRYRLATFEYSASDIRFGYYLELPNEDGVAQPSIELHEGNSAFSFARDLRRNVAFVFKASAGLRKAITAALTRVGKVLEAIPEGTDPIPGMWTQACRRLAEMPPAVFPQELDLPFVRFEMVQNGALKISELQQDLTLVAPLKVSVLSVITGGDGMTKTFIFPYLNGNIPNSLKKPIASPVVLSHSLNTLSAQPLSGISASRDILANGRSPFLWSSTRNSYNKSKTSG